MADERDDNERTEDPTPKRLEEAIKRGDVVKSPEVNTWFMIAAGHPRAHGVRDADGGEVWKRRFAACSPIPIRSPPTGRRWRAS